MWTTTIPDTEDGYASALRVVPGGDVVVTGVVDSRFIVVKLAGATGDVLWSRSLPDGIASSVAVDTGGAVAAAGYRVIPPGYGDLIAAVKVVGASGQTVGCGNGVLDVGEQCDDGNAVAGDGCATDCTHEVCVGGTGIIKARLSMKKLFRPRGDESMRLQGRLVFAPGTPPGFDPSLKGAQVLVEDLGQAGAPVFDLSMRTVPIPGSGAGACDPATDGWQVSASGTITYKNKSNSIDPPTCSLGSASGLTQLRLRDQRSTHGEVSFKVVTKGSRIPVPTGPLRVTIVVSGVLADGQSGACGSVTFSPPQCLLDGTKLSCR